MTKLKHATGIYKALPYSPDPEDIQYYIDSNVKAIKVLKVATMIKVFGEDKEEKIMESLAKLVEDNRLSLQENGDYKVLR